MKIIKILLFYIIIIVYTYNTINAQEIIKITIEQAEKQFFENNLLLLAERCNISIADAAIVQAKVLNNPTISVGDINFWTKNAVEKMEMTPATFRNGFIFSMELEQMIRTAGKRRKLVNMEKVSKEIVAQEFEAFLLGLKAELRILLHETLYLQSYINIIKIQEEAIGNLVSAYRTQTSVGNIAKSELIRLQSSLIELETEANEVRTDLSKQYKELKVLLNCKPEATISILPTSVTTKNPDHLLPADLFEIAKTSRPEFLLSDLNVKYNEKLLIYEKAQRSPDVALSVNYDRYGGLWNNFVGIGISLDLPMFNHNQGNIKMAKFQIEQSHYFGEHQKNEIFHEIMELYINYKMNYQYYHKLMENDFSEDLDEMLDAYSRNFLNKNINMLEYIDFMYAYKTTKQAILIAKKNLDTSYAELQFSVNDDIK
jgi:cobalt-zinc-cadmium efflux system outer membrane protein